MAWGVKTVTEQDGNYLYIGSTSSGNKDDDPYWQIYRVTLLPNLVIVYAKGTDCKVHQWSKRKEYEYL